MLTAALNVGLAGNALAFNNASGYTHIVSNASGKCVDIVTESTLPGFFLDQLDCRNAKSQEWKGLPVVIDNQLYVLLQNHNGDLCANIVNDSGANGTQIDQEPCAIVPEQEWLQFNIPGGSPHATWLINRAVGKCLDLENGGADNGIIMQVWDCNFNTKNQSWAFL
jgi:hypothetical protein